MRKSCKIDTIDVLIRENDMSRVQVEKLCRLMTFQRKGVCMTQLCTERFTVTYRIEAPTYEEAKAVAWSVQVEQTIEFPYVFLWDEDIKRDIPGRLESLDEVASGVYEARISYGVETTAFEVTQLLNVIFGNSSLQPHIWVVDIDLPPSMIAHYGGPRFGVEGLRRLTGTHDRAFLQAVVKPMGLSVHTLADMCRQYVLGGADVIKDDHGITNQPFAPFKERVQRCADAVREANEQSGRHTLYAANVSADGDAVLERAYAAKKAGATALMIAPALVGYSWLQRLANDENLGLPIISHPAFMGGFVLPGVSGIADYLWMAYWPRLFGSDMNIFVSYGGRFTFSKEACQRIHQYCNKPVDGLKAVCAAPGGGVTEARLPELLDAYGKDTMFLVGGDMFRRGHDLQENTKAFVEILASHKYE